MKKKIVMLTVIAALFLAIACLIVACGDTSTGGARERMTVTFETGTDEKFDSVTVEYGKPYGVLPEPVRKYYEFEGWEYRPRGSEIAETVDSATAVKEVRDHTLYAMWKFVGMDDDMDRFSVDSSHCLRIDDEGNIWSWGLNYYGEIGDGTDESRIQPVKLDTEKKFKKVWTAAVNSYAIDVDGGLWAWGQGGAIGDGTTKSRLSPVHIAPKIKFADITTHIDRCYAIDEDNNLWVWGSVLSYNKSTGKTDKVMVSAPQLILDGIKKVAAGSYHVLALTTDGKLVVWGKNNMGQLGSGTKTDSPPIVLDGKRYVDISAYNNTSAAIDGNGKVWAWGENRFGQAGCGKTDELTEPIEVMNVPACVKVRINSSFGYAIDTENRLLAWGDNSNGQLGDNIKETDDVLPTLSVPDMRVSNISDSCAVIQDVEGSLWCRSGRVIDPDVMQANITPTKIESEVKFVKIAAGRNHAAAIDGSGDIWSWGSNNYGQLGDGTFENRYVPVKLDIQAKFIDIQAASYYNAALDVDGNIWTWGYGSGGQLGDGEEYTTVKGRNIPKQITEGVKYTQIQVCENCAYALDSEGDVWAWGNSIKILTERASLKPVKALENTDYVRIHGSNLWDLLATDSEGHIWSYEDGKYGKDMTAKYGFNKIFSTKGGSNFAYDGDGKLWGWGDNSAWQLADINVTFLKNLMNPREVYDYYKYGVLDDIACYFGTVLAIDGDGNLCSWGRIGVGMTGTGKVYTSDLGYRGYQEPQPFEKIDTDGTKFVQVDIASSFGMALDEDGNVWTWGDSNYLGRGKKTGWTRVTFGEV